MVARRRIALLALALLGSALLTGCEDSEPDTATIEIRGRQFVLELAIDPVARERGLMDREYLAPDGGMIFVFPDAGVRERGFWMGNCLVDIDIIFLDRGQRITAMHEMKVDSPRREGETEWEYNNRLPQYPSRYPAQFAIELAAGTLRSFDPPLETGERLDFPAEHLKELAY